MMFDLTGKCALVTGATGGIGGAVARAFHAQGATVTLSGTKAEKLDALAHDLKALNGIEPPTWELLPALNSDRRAHRFSSARTLSCAVDALVFGY